MADTQRSPGGARAQLVPVDFVQEMTGRAAQAPDSRTPGVDGDTWLARLPGAVDDALARWDLRVDEAGGTGPLVRHGVNALVVPVRRRDGSPAALKLTWPHPEARHEHLALRAWGGRGAVGLLAAYPSEGALLLERLDPAADLTGPPVDEACATIGALLRTLDRPALPQLDRLSEWTRRFLADPGHPRVPRRFVDQARALARGLLRDDPGLDARLVHADLHYENVLARPGVTGPDRWVAIDPKPLAAEPAYAVWPALHNRWAEATDGDLAWEIRCRLGWLCDAAGIDEDRARAWAIIRTVEDALDTARSADRPDPRPDSAPDFAPDSATDVASGAESGAAPDAEQDADLAATVQARILLLKALQPDA